MPHKKTLIKWACIPVSAAIISIHGLFNNGALGGDFILIIIYIHRMNSTVKSETNRFWHKLILFGHSTLGLA